MRLVLLLISFLLPGVLSAQLYNPVLWTMTYKPVSETEFELIFTADIEDGWNIYSQYLENDDGPVRTSFSYDMGDHFELVGKNVESGTKKEGYDPLFDMNVIKLLKKITFTQRIKVKDFSKPVTGYVEFMSCDATKCLPPAQEDFSFSIKKPEAAKTEAPRAKTQQEKSNPAENTPEPAPEQPARSPSQPAGILEPVKWSASVTKTGEGEYELAFTAQLENGWYIYSQFLENPDGPIPTTFTYDPGEHYTLFGKTEETGTRKEGYDPLFDMNVVKFSHKAVFKQKLRVQDTTRPLTGIVEFATCDDEKCLPPSQVPFKADLASLTMTMGEDVITMASIPSLGEDDIAIFGNFGKPDLLNPVGQCGEEIIVPENRSSWGIFILGFLGGLLALLTPCVFPMIPLTVSFFTKGSQNRRKGMTNAFLYGFFILLVYLILSIPFHLMDSVNPDILNDISTNIWLNLLFFAVFLFFAFSFFGYYELTLPNSWVNRVSAAEGVGGIFGVFFMALTLALVSFSCTGPILGSLLAGALTSEGGAWQLTSGMAGFGLALALPFGLFAAFPGWMNSLPKSGGWLNSVKVVLGFLELALALKFLSNADLVKHWGILKIEPFLALWIVIFLGMGLYLIGVIRFPHDSPMKKLPIGRLLLGLASFGLVIYLASGFLYDKQAGSYRSLKLLSGLAPPVCYSWFQSCDCPQNLNCFKDFNEGLTYARKVNKPIMIDFTGHACVNCRKMEEHVWPKNEVYKQLRDDYVLISLYVDDKRELPGEEQRTVSTFNGKKRTLRTYGNKWSHFQTTYFATNSQPYYVLISPDGYILNPPVGYTPDTKAFADFLRCGQDAFLELTQNKHQEAPPSLGINE